MHSACTKQNVLSLSKSFALQIVKLYQDLTSNKREYVLSKQLLRSATSIGANIKEAQFAQSKADFIAKMYIALKEAGETEYWVELLYEAQYLEAKEFKTIIEPCRVIIRMLNAITKTAKKNFQIISHYTLHTIHLYICLSDNETRKRYMTWQQELDDLVYDECQRTKAAEKRASEAESRADAAESRAVKYEKILKEHGLL